jgi:hypothetical protein
VSLDTHTIDSGNSATNRPIEASWISMMNFPNPAAE